MTRATGPLSPLLKPIAWIAARLYGVGVSMRNAKFDAADGIEVLEANGTRVPVISVGNVTAGGTGKSPVVAWICEELARSGKRPVIALRGYRSHAAADGRVESDEAQEYAITAPSALVVVGAHRLACLREALSKPEVASWIHDAVVVLDDGFQHRQLARALDIVLVDATRHGLDGDLLPNGWLREPARALRRAGLVIVTKAEDALQRTAASQAVTVARGIAPEAHCTHAWRSLSVYTDGIMRRESVEWLATRRVVIASALGNPAQFRGAVERARAVVIDELRKSDHRAFAAQEVERLLQHATNVDACVLTRKDFVKLDAVVRGTVVVPDLEIAMDPASCARLRAAIDSVSLH